YTPCGHCRQFMNELNSGLELRINLPGRAPHTLSDYLPDAFGPKDLEIKTLLMDEQDHGYALSGDELSEAAIAAANKSHTPYSKSPSGVALQCRDGRIFTGSYAENAAFNPTLPPLQGALNLLSLNGYDYPDIQRAILAEKADLGIALDGDGDRVIMVDHEGNKVDGDQILYIIAREGLRQGQLRGGAVGTLMSNMGLELALKQLGIPFVRAKVGDRYVLEKLQEKGWRIGAENSGHVILLDKTTTGDGIVAALQVVAAMARNHMSLHDLCSGMKMFPQILVNVRFTAGKGDPLENDNVKAVMAEVEATLGSRGRVLLRKSGTEPLIRVMVEGEDEAQVTEFAHRIADAVKAA
ncbi:MAG: cytidine deaminase, partial [Enterobacter hormaechei]|nr:cytidine deaminase [Enterobacter hormaechei]